MRRFDEHRQQILEEFINIRNKYNPSMIFCPTLNDIHQDHAVAAKECVRAFKHSSILGYIFPWNNFADEPTQFVELERKHLIEKCNAVKCFQSQSQKFYVSEESIYAMSRNNGLKIGAEFAEAFSVIRSIRRLDNDKIM